LQSVLRLANLAGARGSWRQWAVYPLLLLVVGVWGGSFVASRLVLAPATNEAALSPTLLAAVRFALAALLFLPILYGQHRRVQPLRLADVPAFLLVGFVGVSLYFWLQYAGIQLTNAGLAAVLVVGTIPLATTIVAALALGEPLGGRRLAALALGSVGVAIVAGQRGLQVSLAGGFLLGVLCLIANAFCFAIYSTLVRGLRDRYQPLTVTAGMTVAGAALLLLWSLANDDWTSVLAVSPRQWLAIVYLAVVCSVIAYVLYNYALTRLRASQVTAWMYLEPPVAVLVGAVMLGEVVSAPTIVGGSVILLALVLLQRQ
jgi:drug/metabolite transporter (DMT)-like permease